MALTRSPGSSTNSLIDLLESFAVLSKEITFMLYKVVLKDERRTSNIERPTSNEKQTSNTEHSTIWQLFNDLYDSHRILEQPFF